MPKETIEFDSPAEAVAVAERLNKEFPKGVPPALLVGKYVNSWKSETTVNPQTEEKVTEKKTEISETQQQPVINAKTKSETVKVESEKKSPKETFEMTQEEFVSQKKDKTKRLGHDSFVLNGVQIYQNPTSDDYIQIKKDVS